MQPINFMDSMGEVGSGLKKESMTDRVGKAEYNYGRC